MRGINRGSMTRRWNLVENERGHRNRRGDEKYMGKMKGGDI